jgi:protein involved in polysaccharide export with SLBB domain
MRVTRPLMLVFFAVAIAAAGCTKRAVIPVQMAAPGAYGVDNVVYGATAPTYGPAAGPAYAAAAPVAAPGYQMAAAPAYQSYAAPVTMAGGYPQTVAASPASYTYAPASYAPAIPDQPPYTLDSGDRLRVVVFGQDGLTNSYVVDASGQIAMPLIGIVSARGLTADQLSARIADMLRQGFIREPHIAVEVEAYRPFFILGEVAQPGQYPYSPNMTVETAVAIAGGFGPRGYHRSVTISRNYNGQTVRFQTPVTASVLPGDTIQVQERWF